MAQDLTGRKFHFLTALFASGQKSAQGRSLWVCQCLCGNKPLITDNQLITGRATSCGCIRREKLLKRNTKHGHAVRGKMLPEYGIWCGIKERCYNPNEKAYKYYGGRGISMSQKWQDSFENFYTDMGPRPSENHSIDRINNDGNYEPSNCRWATDREQAQNQSTTRLMTYNGKTLTMTEWARTLNMSIQTLHSRLCRGWSDEKALSTPIIKPKKRP